MTKLLNRLFPPEVGEHGASGWSGCAASIGVGQLRSMDDRGAPAPYDASPARAVAAHNSRAGLLLTCAGQGLRAAGSLDARGAV